MQRSVSLLSEKIDLSQETLCAMRHAPCLVLSRAMHIALNSVPGELIQ